MSRGALRQTPIEQRQLGLIAETVTDLRRGFGQLRLWSFLAQRELGSQFDRTAIGFAWVPLGILLHVALLGPVFSVVFGVEKGYIAYFAVSFSIWRTMTQIIGEAASMWSRAEKYVRHIPMPLSTFLFALTYKSLLLLLLSLPVGIAFAAWYERGIGAVSLLSIPGMVLLLANLSWGSVLLSVAGLRFRDVQRFVPTALFMLYLSTPIIWEIERLGDKTWIANINPLYHTMEVVRAPLLGQTPSDLSWIVAASCAVAGHAVAFVVFASVRRKLTLWM